MVVEGSRGVTKGHFTARGCSWEDRLERRRLGAFEVQDNAGGANWCSRRQDLGGGGGGTASAARWGGLDGELGRGQTIPEFGELGPEGF